MKKRRILLNLRKFHLFLIDLLISLFSYIFICLFFDVCKVPGASLFPGIFLFTAIIAVMRFLFGIYSSVWRFGDSKDYLVVFFADIASFFICCAIDSLFLRGEGISTLFVAFNATAGLLALLASRFVYKEFEYAAAQRHNNVSVPREYAAIIGAGNAGTALAAELLINPSSEYIPYCFFDSDIKRLNKKIRNLPVLGGTESIKQKLEKTPVTTAIIAMPHIPASDKAAIINECINANLKVRIFDYAFDSNERRSTSSTIREINPDELLGREPVVLNNERIKELVKGKRVMVTGGGGSIGSELCRQIAALSPSELIILDIYENNAYDIQQKLIYEYGKALKLSVIIASVRDSDKINCVFEEKRPDIVFHAAAHKHVPLMEDCADEAVKNNIFGTNNVINAAEKYGVEKMILISSDKAVNPTNVMGATKRACEMLLRSKKSSKTSFAAVRFGNVLGSNGSVIPVFKMQIAAGGPVTVTDRRITRYFMTIPEAVQLVLQAASMADKSDIFVLDMGQPVNINDLAKKMIILSGYKPDIDIQIKEIGLRPGEKLYEELLMTTEELDKTGTDKIFIERDSEVSEEFVDNMIEKLKAAAATHDNDAVKKALMRVIKTYNPQSEATKTEKRDSEALITVR